ncbi:hypothetical protein QTG54_008549 [Skeletonema marinoi]|uniref:Uncharacterized protein n=1 Tax=Skeletonema marinoi TaxID=267567 RepID=A0AAD8Y659_9STRA|nr:hypothetical protein QTG54_008549 [Skeletonema marinoi]
MDHSDTNNDAHSINEEDTTTSGSSSQLNVTMKRRSFSHDYYGSCARSGASDVNDDGDSEVRLTSSAQLHPLSHEHGDNNSIQPTQMENSTLSRQQRQKQRQSKSSSVSERRRCRTQGDVLLMGADDRHLNDEHTINRERANTCPQHQFHHDLDERDEDEDLLSVIYYGEDEEAGGVARDDETHRLHGSGSNERRTRSLPSSSTLLSPERQSISSYTSSAAPSSPRRRAASASSVISSLQQQTSTATLLHTPSTTTTTTSISSYTSTTIKHTLLKLLMLISIYQLLSYTYNTGLSPDVKYQLGEINYDIEEYWNGGRLWSLSSSGSSNRLSASRIVGSSGISFNDDYDVGEDVEEGVVGFISSILSEKFGNQDEGGEGIVDVEEERVHEKVVAVASGASTEGGEDGGTNLSSSRVDSTTVKKKSEETTAAPIIVANSNNITKRRPAMAHVISISENRHPVYLPRASSSRRMKSNEVHWTFSRIAGAIIWIGLMIPILEVGIREVSRRYRLGSLLRRRLRMLRGGFRRRSPENVHIL